MRLFKKHKLSTTEKKIMDFFWTEGSKDEMTGDLKDHLREAGLTLDHQSIEAHLHDLQKAGILRTKVKDGMCYYYATMSKEEYAQPAIIRLFKKLYIYSTECFIDINNNHYSITDEEADELQELIRSLTIKAQEEEE